MNDEDPFSHAAVHQRIARIGFVRVSLWFLSLGLLACIPVQIVVAMRGDRPGPTELILRMVLGLVSFSIAMSVFLMLIVKYGRKPAE